VRDGRRVKTLAAALTALALLAAACGSSKKSTTTGTTGEGGSSSTSAGGAKDGGIFHLGIVEPTAIDPYDSQESEGENVTKAIYEGLVKLDNKTSELLPGVASKWTHTPDCTQWTFNLRPDTKFSNGETVTAQSFIDGMTRAAIKDAASDTAHFMEDIEGYAAIHGTDTAPPSATTLSGVSAPDPNTLQVKLAKGNCEFDKKTLQPVFSPVPKTAPPGSLKGTFADMPIGNGPFMMKEPWQHDKSITVVRNPSFYGTKAHLDEVDFAILPSENAAELEYKNFQSGQADYARIPPALVPQAKSTYEPQKEFISELKYGINYLLVNVKNPPLNNAKARQAISWAIDRDAVIAGVFKGAVTKATSLVPPPLQAFYQANVCDSCDKPNVAKAKQLATEGGLVPGTKLNFMFNTGGGHEGWVQAVAQQLKDNLGLDVNVAGLPFKELLKKEQDPNASGMFRAAWGADYPSADDFLRPLLSRGSLPPGDNRGLYQNDQFDKLIDQAVATPDPTQAASITKQAEKLAIGDDLALIPLWYRNQYRVFSSKFKNVGLDFFENPTVAEVSQA